MAIEMSELMPRKCEVIVLMHEEDTNIVQIACFCGCRETAVSQIVKCEFSGRNNYLKKKKTSQQSS